MKRDANQTDQKVKMDEVFEILDPDKLLNIARKLKGVMERRHGEVILIVKNGELAFVDVRLSEDVRSKKGCPEGQN
ncbi:MAG TPA: hypothetical protein VN364_08190 [Bellilinea sp.]|nr:hypothetical protein [Bellilinea sp.]